jgi:hypothetical protein
LLRAALCLHARGGEGAAAEILFVTGLFAHPHQRGAGETVAEYDRCGLFEEVATAAP